jgi:hypothetical protein
MGRVQTEVDRIAARARSWKGESVALLAQHRSDIAELWRELQVNR